MAAAPAQQHPAQHRDVVVPGDRPLAVGAVRTGADHGEIAREAVDTDVHEAADQQPAEEHQCVKFKHTAPRGQSNVAQTCGPPGAPTLKTPPLMNLAFAYFTKLYSAAMFAIARPSTPSRNPRLRTYVRKKVHGGASRIRVKVTCSPLSSNCCAARVV